MTQTFGKRKSLYAQQAAQQLQTAGAGASSARMPKPSLPDVKLDLGFLKNFGFLVKRFSFFGRAGRLEYWGTYFVSIFVLIALGLLLGVSLDPNNTAANSEVSSAAGMIFLVVYLAVIVVNLAVCVRRYHDRGKSGFWIFLMFIPIIGIIWQFIELGFLAGDPGVNGYE